MVAIDPSTAPTQLHTRRTVTTSCDDKVEKENGRYRNVTKDGLFRVMATKLHWTSRPHRLVPHGLSGIMLVTIGFYLSFCSITGNLGPYGVGPQRHYYVVFGDVKYLLYTFLLLGFINGITGFILAPTSTKIGTPIFRRAGVTVVCLVYYAIRFMPEFYTNTITTTTTTTSATASSADNNNNNNKNSTSIIGIVRIMDILFCFLIVGTTVSFWKTSYEIFASSKSSSIALVIGSFGMSTFSAYPIQLLLDPLWLECIVQQYPLQGVAMTAYVYVPSITVFSLCSFLPTLYLRKMITDIELGLSIGTLVVGILLVAVTSQELIVPDVSTQKLYIPCNVPTDTNSFDYQLMDYLDVSKLTRNFLTGLGIPLPKPMYTEL